MNTALRIREALVLVGGLLLALLLVLGVVHVVTQAIVLALR